MFKRLIRGFRSIGTGVRNVVAFFPVVWQFRSWDYVFSLELFLVGLKRLAWSLEHGLAWSLEHGIEVPETLGPKVKCLYRICELLRHVVDDQYVFLAEQELGQEIVIPLSGWIPADQKKHPFILTDEQKATNRQIFARANEREAVEWNELWARVAGSDEYPGSDLRGYWD